MSWGDGRRGGVASLCCEHHPWGGLGATDGSAVDFPPTHWYLGHVGCVIWGKIVLSVSSFFLFVLERYRDVCLWDVWSNFMQSIATYVCTWLIGQRSHKNCKYSRSPLDGLLRCLFCFKRSCESWCINMRMWFLQYDAYVFIIYTSFWKVGIQQPASMSQLSTNTWIQWVWFDFSKSFGKV